MNTRNRWASLGLAMGLGLLLVGLLFAPAWAQGEGPKDPTPEPAEKALAQPNAPTGGFVSFSESSIVARNTHAGDTILYTVIISHTGDTLAENTEVTIHLPFNATLDTDSPYAENGPAPTQQGNTLRWTGTITQQEAVILHYQMQPPPATGEWVETEVTIYQPMLPAAWHMGNRFQVQPILGGPDDYGYTFMDSDADGGPSFSWVMTTTALSKLNFGSVAADDAVTGPVPINFTFQFYTGTFTQMYVSSNGLVLFGGPSTDNYPGPVPGTPDDPSSGFATCLGGDLYIKDASQGAWVETYGLAPNRTTVITWRLEYFFTSGDYGVPPAVFQMILHEGSNRIKCQYLTMAGPTFSTGTAGLVAVENLAGTTGLVYFYDTEREAASNDSFYIGGPLVDNLAVQFYPGAANLPLLATSTLSASHNVHPGGPVTYTLAVVNSGNAAANSATVTNPIPAGASYVNGSAQVQGGGSLTPGPGGVNWAGSIAAGARITITYRLSLTTVIGTVITNTATVNAANAARPVVLVNDRVTVLPPPESSADEWGYFYYDTYRPGGGISFNWYPTTTALSKLNFGTAPVDDAVTGTVPLGFSFIFYGRPYTQVSVSTNGLVLFGDPTFTNVMESIPTPGGVADNYAACFGSDLIIYDDSQGIWVETSGSPGNRIAVITYRVAHFNNSTGPAAEFQMQLYETYNVIHCHYRHIPDTDELSGGRGAIIGIEAHDGTAGTQYYFDPNPNVPNYGPLESRLAVGLYDGLDGRAALSASDKAVSRGMHPGEQVTYTLVARNNSLVNAPAATIFDTYPAGTTYVNGSAQAQGGGTVTPSGASLFWGGSLAGGQTVTVTFALTLPAAVGPVTNTATFAAGNASNAVRSALTVMQPPIGLGSGDLRYRYRDSYSPGINYTWVPTTGASLQLAFGDYDEGVSGFSLGFTFPFYGRSYGYVQVTTNGLVLFNGASQTDYGNQPIPTTGTMDNFATCLWDNMIARNTTDQGVWVETMGSQPNRTAVISFILEDSDNPAERARTFQMILFEADGRIKCQYLDVGDGPAGTHGDGSRGTVGVENEYGTGGTQYFFERDEAPFVGPLEPGLAIVFEPVNVVSLPGVYK